MQYIEQRDTLPSGMYVLDPEATHPFGHKEIDPDGELQVWTRFYGKLCYIVRHIINITHWKILVIHSQMW